MLLSEEAEEILEAIWIVHEDQGVECVRLSNLRLMPDTAVLRELIDTGIVERCGKEGIRLSEKGSLYAKDAVRRHRLAERLLTDVLAVKKEMIHETACAFEHHLHKGIDVNVCTLLGHPRVCPHGRPIPRGRCCEEGAKFMQQAVSPIAGLKPGQSGLVAYLSTIDPKRAQMLITMGVVPGVRVKLLAGFPSYLFQLGEGQFAIDSEIAREIYVRVES